MQLPLQPLDKAASAQDDAGGGLARLLHEVRQPLSGIEAIAYYLEIALESEDEEVRQQCGRLRSLVSQANWLLTDASIDSGAFEGSCCLNEVLFSMAERMALHGERALELRLADSPLICAVGECGVKRIAGHVLAFLTDVAGSDSPVRAGTLGGKGLSVLRLSAALHGQRAAEFAALLKSLQPAGLAGLMSRLGGSVDAFTAGEALEIELRFPAPGDESDQAGF